MDSEKSEQETLQSLIKKYESKYEISITIKSRSRKLPAISVFRGDYFEDNCYVTKAKPQIFRPIYVWQNGDFPSRCAEEVNDELIQLVELSKLFGAVLCKG